MRKTKIKSYRKLVAMLRDLCPAIVPVHPRRMKMKKVLGLCIAVWGEDDELLRFDIRINSEQSWDSTWETLLHEWAHAVAWTEGHENVEDHGPEWGVAYARIYRETV